MENRRRSDIELMRIVAAYFVVFNHTRPDGFLLFTYHELGSFAFWVDLFISVFCKLAVPLFFMISGALLLSRDPEPLGKLWKHRILKMAVLLLVWSFFYYLLNIHQNNVPFRFMDFARTFYESEWNYAFWYLYAYVAMLISLPLLQRIAKALSNKEYLYLFALYVFLNAVLPMAEYLLWQGSHTLNSSFNLTWICSNIFIFPLCGYFLEYRVKEKWSGKKLVLLWLLNIITILISCVMTYYKAKITGLCDEGNSQTFFSSFVIFNSSAVYVTCQQLFMKRHVPEWTKKCIQTVGGCTFGVYLLHILFMTTKTSQIVAVLREQCHLGYMISALLYSLIIFLICFAVTFLLKKIPILKKLVT